MAQYQLKEWLVEAKQLPNECALGGDWFITRPDGHKFFLSDEDFRKHYEPVQLDTAEDVEAPLNEQTSDIPTETDVGGMPCSIGTIVDKSQATELSSTSNMPPAECGADKDYFYRQGYEHGLVDGERQAHGVKPHGPRMTE